MDSILLDRYLKIFEPLSVELKVELIAALSQSIKLDIRPTTPVSSTDKEALFEELKGAWSDVDEDVERLIYESRTISDREITFD